MDNSPPYVLSVAGSINSEDKTTDVSKILQDNRPKYKLQFLAAFICCLAPLAGGMTGGFTSPAIPDMNRPGRSLPLTTDASSWMTSFMPIGGLFGGLVAGIAMDFYGRKSCLIYSAALCVLGWLFIVYANAYVFLYIGRFITGACCGITCSNAPVYLAEIASPKIRGILGVGFQIGISLGILLAYIIGAFVPWTYLAAISAIFPVLQMIFMSFMPETPVWLVKQGRIIEAQNSIKWLRGSNYDFPAEIEEIINSQKNTAAKLTIKEILQPYFIKPFLLIETLLFFQQFTGFSAVIAYASNIFDSTAGTIDPNIQAIILGVVMVISNLSASLFVDRAGRRLLLLSSCTVISITSLVTGGYYYFLAKDSHSAVNFSWLPMACILVFILLFNFGLGPIPWLLMGELFPIHVRGTASSLLNVFNSLTMFLATKIFGNMIETIHPYGTFWVYGGFSIVAVVFVWIFVPETKGKSLDEIQELFKRK